MINTLRVNNTLMHSISTSDNALFKYEIQISMTKFDQMLDVWLDSHQAYQLSQSSYFITNSPGHLIQPDS